MKVLLVSDDTVTERLLATALHAHQHEMLRESQHTLFWRARDQEIDLVLYDLGEAGTEQWDGLCRWRFASNLPLITIGPLNEPNDAVKALRLGSDDFVTRPIRTGELVARMEALIRRVKFLNSSAPDEPKAGLRIDLNGHACQVHIAGRAIDLTPTEFKLLELLIEREGYAVSRSELLTRVWGKDEEESSTQLSLYIWHLRQKIEENPARPKLILTRRGIGYCFSGQN